MKPKTIAIFLAIILLGILLRFSFLDKEDYWLDEGFTLLTAESSSFKEVTNSVLFYETTPPLYFYILNVWIKLFGNSAFSTRSLSALFGVFSIIVIFFLSKKIADEKTAFLTALLFSVSMLNVWVSQEVRPYSLFIFLSLLSTLFLLNILIKDTNSQYILYFLSLIALLYTSYFSLFVIFFHFMSFLFLKKYSLLRKIFFIQLVSVLLLVPWLAKALPKSNLSSGIVYELLSYHARLPEFVARFGQFALISPLIFLSLLLILIYFINLKQPLKKPQSPYQILAIVILLSLIVYSILITNFQSSFVRKFFTWSRYFVFLLPVGHFVIAKTFFNLNKKTKTYFIILILLLSSFSLYSYYSSTLREQWTPAMKFIEKTQDSSDGIIFIDEGGANMYLIDYYYDGDMQAVELAWKDKILTIEEVKDLARDKEFAWLILSRNWKRGDYYKNLFDDNFNLAEQKEFHGIKLYFYENS